MQPSIKKDHHFVPQLHLNYFVGSQPPGHIWTYSKISLKSFSSTPRETGFTKYFYGIRQEDGKIDNSIEDNFSEIEGKASPIYQKLVNEDINLSKEEKSQFSIFLALMKFRSPAARRIYAEGFSQFLQINAYARTIHKDGFEAYIKSHEVDTGKILTESEKNEIKDSLGDMSQFAISIPQEQTLATLNSVNPLAEILYQMEWSIGHLNNGYFVTTDNPLIHDVDRNTIHPVYGGFSFANKTCQVIFPLSHKKILFLSWKKIQPIFDVSKSFAMEINKALISHSETFTYSHIKHKEISKLVELLKNDRQEMKISGFGPQKYAETKINRNWTRNN